MTGQETAVDNSRVLASHPMISGEDNVMSVKLTKTEVLAFESFLGFMGLQKCGYRRKISTDGAA